VQAAGDDILGPHIVVRGHHEMRQCEPRLRRIHVSLLQLGKLALDADGAEPVEQIKLPLARGLGSPVGQVHDHALLNPIDRRMRFVDEPGEPFGQPMITARLTAIAVHALLHHHPVAVVGDDETVQVEIEPVLDRGAIDFGNEPVRPGETRAVEADAIPDGDQFVRGLSRMLAAATADVDAEFRGSRCKAALERADHTGCDPRRMPVHPHDGTEGLEPEWMREPAQQLVTAIFDDDRLDDHRPQAGHALAQPFGHAPAKQRQIGATGAAGHQRAPGVVANRHIGRM
jgi:hypothetical protein